MEYLIPGPYLGSTQGRRGSRGVVGHSIGNGSHAGGGGDKGRSSEETAKQAVVLFTIVAIFVFCNFIRIAMNVYDLVYIKVKRLWTFAIEIALLNRSTFCLALPARTYRDKRKVTKI